MFRRVGNAVAHAVLLHRRWAAGTQGTLKSLDFDSSVRLDNGVLKELGYRLYDPKEFRLTRPDGTVYVIHTEKGLKSMTDAGGRTVRYDSGGIHDAASGLSITFERGAGNRIEKISDPYGAEVEYRYDRDGMLVKVVHKGSASGAPAVLSEYAYQTGLSARPLLKEMKGADGKVNGFFEYDGDGRLTGFFGEEPSDKRANLIPYIIGISGPPADFMTREFSGTVSVEIENTGFSDAESVCTVTVFEDTDRSGDFDPQKDTLLGKADITPPRAKEYVMADIQASGVLLFAGNRIFAAADTGNTVDEADETDNVTHSMAECSGAACTDIAAFCIRTEVYDFPEYYAAVTVRIGNAGITDIPENTAVSFYDGDPGAGGMLLGTVGTTAVLHPGECEDIFFRWENPGEGIHTLHIAADDDGSGVGSIPEADETDNRLSYTFFPICFSPGREISLSIPEGGTGTVTVPPGSVLPGTEITVRNLTAVAEVSGTADSGGLTLPLSADFPRTAVTPFSY